MRPTLRPIREPWPEKPRVELPGRSAEGPSWSPGGVLLARDGVGWGAEASLLNTGHPRAWTVSPGAACQPRVLLPCSEHAGRSQATLGGCAPAGRVPRHPGELGGDAHSEAFLMVTGKRTTSRSVSRPLLFSCHSEPLQGRLCARATSGDPFLPQATHPGVNVGMTKEEQSGNCLQCTRRESRHCVGQPHSPTPKYCCVVPGVWDFRTKGRSLLVPKPDPRGESRLHQLPMSETRNPRPGRGWGVQAGHR